MPKFTVAKIDMAHAALLIKTSKKINCFKHGGFLVTQMEDAKGHFTLIQDTGSGFLLIR